MIRFFLYITTTLFLSASGIAQALTSGLIAYYPFTGGSLNDMSGNSHHGTNLGTTAAADMFGTASGARYFNGSSRISIPHTALFRPTTFPVSISMWVKIPTTAMWNYNHVFYNSYDPSDYYGLQMTINPGGYLYAGYGDGGGPQPGSRRSKTGYQTSVADGQWHMATIVIHGATNMDLYVDCSPEPGNYSGSGGPIAYPASMTTGSIGACGGAQGVLYTTGTLDEIRFYNRALTQADVNALYALGTLAVNLGPDQVLCNPISLNPGTNPGASYLWSTGATSSAITATVPGTYWVQVTKGCAVQRDTVVIAPGQAPAIDLGADKVLCSGASLLLQPAINVTAGASYLWNNGQTGSTQTITMPGLYWVEVTTPCGIARDTVIVNGLPSPVLSLGPDQTLCAAAATLVATGNAMSVQWSGPGIVSAAGMSAVVNQSGAYVVTGFSDNGCQRTDTVLITLVPAPVVNLGGDTTVCDSFVLNAGNPGCSYLWNTGTTTRIVTYNASGTYWVQVTHPLGCSTVDTIQMTVIPGPVANFTATWQGGLTVQLNNASAHSSSSWWEYDGPGGSTQTSTTTHPLITAPAPGNFYVMLISSNACGADTSIQVIDWEKLTPVEASALASVRVFPNPAKEVLYLTGMPEGISLVLVNGLGQTVWQGESTDRETAIGVSGLAEGLYWLKDEAGTLRTAVVVKQ